MNNPRHNAEIDGTRCDCELVSGTGCGQPHCVQSHPENRQRNAQRMAFLRQQMTQSDDFVEGLAQAGDELLALVGAGGAALFFEEQARLIGTTPSESEIRELVQWLKDSDQTRDQALWQTQNLPIEYSKARDWSAALPGLLAISLSQVHRSYVMWFRLASNTPELKPNGNLRESPAPKSATTESASTESATTESASTELEARNEVLPSKEKRLSEEASDERREFATQPLATQGEGATERALTWQTFEIEAANELRNAICGILLKRAEEMAQRAQELADNNRELESFSYSVSHDLRAPLRHINGFAALLHKRAGENLDETSLHYLDTISEAARKGSVLVDNLLGFSRMARSEMSREAVDMNALIGEVQNDLAMELQGRDIAWKIAPLPIVRGDREMLSLALRNLLGNAVKYTARRADARVEIGCLERQSALSAGARAEEVVFFIRDNGAGFDMQYVDKIFGVFQRLHAHEEFEGTGIGLANVQRIIARHGGRVWAQGEIDQGATIFFSLPRRSAVV